jgi:hypothetical protein
LVAVNSNDGGVATASAAMYKCPARIARMTIAASPAASPESDYRAGRGSTGHERRFVARERQRVAAVVRVAAQIEAGVASTPASATTRRRGGHRGPLFAEPVSRPQQPRDGLAGLNG